MAKAVSLRMVNFTVGGSRVMIDFRGRPLLLMYIVLSPLSAPAYAAITCTNTKSQIQRPLVHKMMVGVGFCDATITALSYYPSATRNNTGHHKLSRFM